MKHTTRTRLGATAAAVTIAVGGFLVAGSTSSTAGGTPSWAYGFAMSGAAPAEGTPYVESTDGQEHENTAGEIPDNPLVSGDVARLRAGDGTASVTLTDLTIGDVLGELPEPPPEIQEGCQQLTEQLPTDELQDGQDQLQGTVDELTSALEEQEELPFEPSTGDLSAQQLADLCEALNTGAPLVELDTVEVSCDGGSGRTVVADVRVAGQPVVEGEEQPPPNTGTPENPLVDITFNKQQQEPDGSFTVKGVEISLGGGEQVIDLGVAHCGDWRPDPKPADQPAEEAPAPQPVQERLPVTG